MQVFGPMEPESAAGLRYLWRIRVLSREKALDAGTKVKPNSDNDARFSNTTLLLVHTSSVVMKAGVYVMSYSR